MSAHTRISPSATTGRYKPVTIQSAIASPLAKPTGSAGGDISGSRDDSGIGSVTPIGLSPADWEIEIKLSVAGTITGPLGIFGEKDDGTIGLAGELNDGRDIVIVANNMCAYFPISGLGVFKKLQLGGIASSVTWTGGGNLSAKATPILVVEKQP